MSSLTSLITKPLDPSEFFWRKPYKKCRGVNDPKVYRFIHNVTGGGSLNDLVELVEEFLRRARDEGYFPLLEEGANLKDILLANPYLTVNDKIICFHDDICASEQYFRVPEEFTDRFFTRMLLKDPVRCTQDHVLERRCAEIWQKSRGDICPCSSGSPHYIGTITTDEALRLRIQKFLNDEVRQKELEERFRELEKTSEARQKECEARIRSLESSNTQLKDELKRCQQNNDSLEETKKNLTNTLKSLESTSQEKEEGLNADVKRLTDSNRDLTEEAKKRRSLEDLIKNLANERHETAKYLEDRRKDRDREVAVRTSAITGNAGQLVLKSMSALPPVKAAVGLGLGAYHLYEGHYYTAGFEFASGLSALAAASPPLLFASVIVDIGVLGYHFTETTQPPQSQPVMTPNDAYRYLGLTARDDGTIDKALADAARERYIELIKSDLEDPLKVEATKKINLAYDIIKRNNKWD